MSVKNTHAGKHGDIYGTDEPGLRPPHHKQLDRKQTLARYHPNLNDTTQRDVVFLTLPSTLRGRRGGGLGDPRSHHPIRMATHERPTETVDARAPV